MSAVSNTKTMPGIQSHHCFCSTPDGRKILILVVPVDEESEPTSESKVDHCDLCVGQYVVCLYQNNWCAGTVNNVSVPNGGAEVNFMHPKGPSHFFKWPQKQDMSWVPFENILGILNPPNSDQCGRNDLIIAKG